MLINECVLNPAYAGDRDMLNGHLDIGEHGEEVIVWDKPIDLYSIIQSFAPECDIEQIVKRYDLGDSFALSNKGEGVYLTKEVADCLDKDVVSLNRELTTKFKDLYNTFSGKDNISYSDFVEIVRKGDFSKLKEYMPVNKEEAHE